MRLMSAPSWGLLLLLLLSACTQSKSRKADLVLTNAKVYTVDEDFKQAEAVAIQGSKIIFVGSNAEAAKFVTTGTEVIDLKGQTVVPGLADAHYHFMGVGAREFHLNLDGTKSLEEFLARIEAEVKKAGPGEWVRGRGWMEEDWPTKEFPTRADLDRIAPNNPVFMGRADGHAAVVNSKALELAGITKATPNPQGGEILHDKRSGEPNGLLLDRAMGLVVSHMPPDSSHAMQVNYAKAANATALAYGLTQIHDMGISWDTVNLYKDLYAKKEMQIRIHAYIRGPSDDSKQLLEQGPQIGLFDNHLTVRGIKISQDGALGSRGAALLQPYSDFDTQGLLIYKDEEIYPTIKEATARGIQMAIHAIGDRANRDILDNFARAFAEVPAAQRKIADPRFRIEHAQIVALDDIPRFKELGIIPSMQPSHAIGDLHFAVRRLGLDRMLEAYAWRTFMDQGSYIPGGSDAPVEEGNPMIEFYAGCVRRDTTGFTADGWHPELRMTREEALRALTIWPAKAVFEENIRGSIESGKLADLTVLDRDLMTEPEERLFDIKAVMTIVGGDIVFRRENLMSQKD